MNLLRRPGTPEQNELLDLASEYDALRQEQNERIARMQLYKDENDAARDPHVAENIRDLSDYGRKGRRNERHRHNIPLPFGKALTVKHSFRIAGRLPDVIVDQRDESPQERHRSDVMEKIVWAVLRASGGETTLSSGAWHASEMGAACFDLYFDIRRQMPVFRVCDPEDMVVVRGVDEAHDFQRVYRSWDVPVRSLQAEYRDQFYLGEAVRIGAITPAYNEGGTDLARVVQFSDKQKTVRFAMGAEGAGVVGLYEHHHGHGFAPYIVIPNIGPYEDIWGWADYEFVRSLQAYLGALFSREADILKSVANGAAIEKGTGANPERVLEVLREGGVLPSRREGSVDPIQAPEMPSFHENHAERSMEMFKMLGFAPDAAWGKPGSASGTDRGLQLQPLLEYTALKQMNWQAGLTRLFAYAYQMIEQKMAVTTKYRGAVHASGNRRLPFVLELGPNADPTMEVTNEMDEEGLPIEVPLPRSPRELFDGDYEVRFVFQNRIDPDDPSFVTSELAKFAQGAQSLQTTLERLGFQAPEDEMRRIEAESKRFPWVNQGLVSLLMAQMRGNAQGLGGGNPGDPAGGPMGALGTMGAEGGGAAGGALDADAGFSQLEGPGVPYGAA